MCPPKKFPSDKDQDDSLLAQRLARLGIREEDLEESFETGGGPGGQKINKVSNRVRLVHKTTGTAVVCQESRSRVRNRMLARERLCDILEARQEESRQEKARARAARRARHRRPGPAAKRRHREANTRHSRKKSLRRRPSAD